MAWYESILKAAGKQAAGQLLDQIGGPNARRLKKLLLGKDAEVKETLNRLEEKIGVITKTTKSTRLHQMFDEYNRAHSRLETMYNAYEAQAGKPGGDEDRRNACLAVLSSKGAYEQARRMSSALFHKNVQNNMSFFQEYSEDLTADRPEDDPTPLPDVFSYYDKMQSVMDHLILNLAAAQELRQRCYKEVGSRQDVELSDAEIQGNNQKYAEIVGPAEDLIDLFEQCAAGGAYVRLQHCASGNYLTVYAGGRPLSEDEPFGSYSSFQMERKGMPQVFAHGPAKGQVEVYQEVTAIRGFSNTYRREVTLDGTSQEWKVIKLGGEGERGRFIFEGRQSKQALDGVNSGRVYVNPLPRDMGNRHMWWQPVLTRNEAGEYEPGVFMLKHEVSDLALDSDGKKVYADNRKPKHSNRYMKWRLIREKINN